jgi:hypothetical protein
MTTLKRLDPDWAHYPNTVLVFDRSEVDSKAVGTGLRVDLRAPISEAVRPAFAALGLSDSFAVLTAYDPQGRDLDPGENRRRAEILESELRRRRVHCVRVDACSPDGGHCERSVAAAMPRADAVALAGLHQQVAIFWFDGERFWIVGVLADAEPIALPVRGSRRLGS